MGQKPAVILEMALDTLARPRVVCVVGQRMIAQGAFVFLSPSTGRNPNVFTTYQAGEGKVVSLWDSRGRLWTAALQQEERMRMLLFLEDSTLL